MDIIERALPNRNHDFSLKYSAHFKAYNSSVRFDRAGNSIIFRLSKAWKEIDDEIKIGLLQSLYARLFKQKTETPSTELYNAFVRNLHIAAPKTSAEPELVDSFARVNQKYFSDGIEQPNLTWGQQSLAKLGSYEYQTDTIVMSSLFKSAPQHLLDYVMYHEMLHKKHKFYTKNSRNYHHTRRFRAEEKQFEGSAQIEKELKKFLRAKKRVSFLSFLFQ